MYENKFIFRNWFSVFGTRCQMGNWPLPTSSNRHITEHRIHSGWSPPNLAFECVNELHAKNFNAFLCCCQLVVNSILIDTLITSPNTDPHIGADATTASSDCDACNVMWPCSMSAMAIGYWRSRAVAVIKHNQRGTDVNAQWNIYHCGSGQKAHTAHKI